MSELQKQVDAMIKSIESTTLRKIMKQSYVCSANCFDRKYASSEQIQQCVEQCQHPSQKAQHVVQKEMENLQNRVQRCQQSCQDAAQDDASLLSPKSKHYESEVGKIQDSMSQCVSKCEKTHVALLSTIRKRIDQQLSN